MEGKRDRFDDAVTKENSESHDAGYRLPPPPPTLPVAALPLPRPPPTQQQQHQQQLLYVDMMNYADHIFPMKASWNMNKSFAATQRFVAAAKNAGFTIKCFLDDAQKSVEAVNKWRSRREREVARGIKAVPQGMTTLLGDCLRQSGAEVCYSVVDNDDTLAYHAHHDGTTDAPVFVLSDDKVCLMPWLLSLSYKYQQPTSIDSNCLDLSLDPKPTPTNVFLLPDNQINRTFSGIPTSTITSTVHSASLLKNLSSFPSNLRQVLRHQLPVPSFLLLLTTLMLSLSRRVYINGAPLHLSSEPWAALG